MANVEYLKILNQGVVGWNQWRKEREGIPFFQRVDLSDADLTSADLKRINLNRAELSRAKLHGADLSEAELRDASLIEAILTETNLRSASLSDAYLVEANLNGANLHSADLSEADLSKAQLIKADLRRADLTNANLNGANLDGANLINTDFTGTSLRGANFQNATTSITRFSDCDLSEARGLDFINHQGPSTVGIDAIYRSKGKISESFLRGCGVPESFITQMHSLVGAEEGIQFYSCFISYSSKDVELARRLHGRMRDAHLRVWFAPEDVQGGKKLSEQIETAIRVFDKLLIVLSQASLQSEWVKTELRKAFKAERQSSKRKLFPVRLVDFETLRNWECFDADSGKDLAIELREYFIPDFSNWKNHDQFEAAFVRLLKDLRADERTK